MVYKEFEAKVMEALQEKLGCGYRVESGIPGECRKTTGRSILIGRQGVNASMIVKMDEYYTKYMHGAARKEGIAQVVSEILDVCKGRIPDCDIDVSKFADWDSIKTHIRARLVNTERNQGHLEKAPHRDFLDLSLEYYADMPEAFPGRQATTPIWDGHMLYWGVDEETLYQTAMEDMEDADDMAFECMDELLVPCRDIEKEIKEGLLNGCPMYVLGNKSRINGAVQICRQDVMGNVSGFFKQDFWILPSSIHEVILLPAGEYGEDAEGLAGIVKEVNDTQLAPEEILSYHVYRYSRLTGEVSIAA